jgi:hypothetical protein
MLNSLNARPHGGRGLKARLGANEQPTSVCRWLMTTAVSRQCFEAYIRDTVHPSNESFGFSSRKLRVRGLRRRARTAQRH